MFQKNIYIERRNALKKFFKKGIIIIPGNSESPMSYEDNCYPFVQDSTFLYFFGLNNPNFIGILDIDNNIDYIFGKDYSIDDIIWMGPQESIANQALKVGIENFKDIDTLNSFLLNKNNILFTEQYRAENILTLSKLLKINPLEFNKFISEDLKKAIIKLRNTKSSLEIEEIEKAVNVTRDMHLEAMKTIKPGMKEYELTAALEYICTKNNCLPSFHTICTVNGETLHNHSQNNILKDGDLLLLDCGARLENGYCGDMTTVFPVSGKFSPVQKQFYNILIKMFNKAEEIIKPNITYKSVHLEVCRVLLEEFKKINLVKGSIENMLEAGVYGLFLPHGLGHMLGLDVHDMENFGEDYVGYDHTSSRSNLLGLKSLRLSRILEPGFVFTVEPGIYFIPELIKKYKSENKFIEYVNYDEVEKYIGQVGMRYEGDFVITESGNRRLGKTMPKTVEEIENILEKRN